MTLAPRGRARHIPRFVHYRKYLLLVVHAHYFWLQRYKNKVKVRSESEKLFAHVAEIY